MKPRAEYSPGLFVVLVEAETRALVPAPPTSRWRSKYDAGAMAAPIVLAKGYDEVAQRIKAIAAEHNITMVENVALARALAKEVDIGKPVPTKIPCPSPGQSGPRPGASWPCRPIGDQHDGVVEQPGCAAGYGWLSCCSTSPGNRPGNHHGTVFRGKAGRNGSRSPATTRPCWSRIRICSRP
jgi:hypothetical protein